MNELSYDIRQLRRRITLAEDAIQRFDYELTRASNRDTRNKLRMERNCAMIRLQSLMRQLPRQEQA